MKINKITKHDKIFRIKRNKKSMYFMPVMIIIGVVMIASIPIAMLWQKNDKPMEKQTTPQYVLDREAAKKAEEERLKEEEKEKEKSENESENNSESSESSKEESVAVSNAAVVKESEWVESSYFDDAVFVGDSLSVGIDIYEVMTNAKVLAAEGLNPQTIKSSTAVKDKSGNEVKVIDALNEINPGKIYIMLGSNGFFWMDKETFMSNYEDFLNEVKAQHPNAVIYVQSIMPVTKEKEQKDSRFANSIINDYNNSIISICEKLNLNYLDCAAAVRGDDGALPEDASNDGMHFNSNYYRKWMDYLRNHTV